MAVAKNSTSGAGDGFKFEPNADYRTTPGTVAFWFKYKATGAQTRPQFFVTADSGDRNGIIIAHYLDDTKISALNLHATNIASNLTSTTTFGSGGSRPTTWTHLAYVWRTGNGETNRLYINGVEEANGTNSAAWSQNSTVEYIFGSGWNNGFFGHWEGSLAEVAMYSGEITAGQALSLGRGASPLLVAPNLLESYFPCIGRTLGVDNVEIDVLRGRVDGVVGMQLVSTGQAVDAHPPVRMPTMPLGARGSAALTGWGPLLGMKRSRLVAG